MEKNHVKRRALAAAFPRTLPILTGFGFLGIAYGIYMRTSGFHFLYPTLTSMIVFGGSLEFVLVSMLMSAFAPLQTFLLALMIQARHLFYGVAMLEKYKGLGWKKGYLIFGLCDETFSVNCSADIPRDVDKGWFLFFVTLLNQSYWVIACTLGGVLGSLIQFNTEGLDFVMTAMFVVIFLEQWLKEKKHYTALIGVIASVLCRLIFGVDSFLVPTMICILAMLSFFRKPIEKAGDLS
ncbi:MAG: AzlC family ABC transporter permease [Clostridia bacterium]|nr:AzlC family ABC transporter permease [Clostridia bacterium]MBQ6803017.1 AzlC family ABC transporter permease [Clostridia bacterium]